MILLGRHQREPRRSGAIDQLARFGGAVCVMVGEAPRFRDIDARRTQRGEELVRIADSREGEHAAAGAASGTRRPVATASPRAALSSACADAPVSPTTSSAG